MTKANPQNSPRLTDLPDGTLVRFRYRGEWDYATIGKAGRTYQLCPTPLPGTEVHQVVWKKHDGRERMELRKVVKVRPPKPVAEITAPLDEALKPWVDVADVADQLSDAIEKAIAAGSGERENG